MAGYIGPIPVPQATQTRETFTATASQTTFNTAGYQPGYLDVFMNGVKLIDGSDYTATNGSDVVLSSGAAVNDLIEVVAYTAFEVLNQNFTGTTTVADLTVTGDLTVDGTTTTINSTTLNVDDINITVASGAADAAAANGAGLTVDGANATFNYASSGDKWTMNKPLDSAGIVSAVDRFFVSGTAPQVRLSPTSGDATDSDRAMFGLATSDGHFFADALDGDAILRSPTNGKLLFGTGLNERARLHNNGSFAIGTTADQHASSTAEGIYLYPGSSSSMSANSPVLRLNRNGTGGNNRSNLELYNNGTLRGFFGTLGVEGGMYFGTGNGAATNMTLYEDETVVNEDSIDHNFRVESDNNTHAFFVDAQYGNVGIKRTSPSYDLDVNASFRTVYSVPAYSSTTGTGSSSDYWKLGTVSNLVGSRSLKIRILGTSSYSAGGNIAGETTILFRANNSGTTTNGTFWSETSGNNHVAAVAWKQTGTNDQFDIWVKWASSFAGTDIFVETAGQWVFDISNTGSTSQPSGSTLISPRKANYIGDRLALNLQTTEVSVNDTSNDMDFRVESNANSHLLFVDASEDQVLFGTTTPRANSSGLQAPSIVSGTGFAGQSLDGGSTFQTTGWGFGNVVNVTKTVQIYPGNGGYGLLEVHVAGYNSAGSGTTHALFHAGGHTGTATLYNIQELYRYNYGNLTTSAATLSSGRLQFTVATSNTGYGGHTVISIKSMDVGADVPRIVVT
jgi:hypothetical protein